jgi:hypothetical protein
MKKRRSRANRFPEVDRSKVLVGNVLDDSDEKEWWLAKTPEDRLEALEMLREIAYGDDPTRLPLALPRTLSKITHHVE